MKRAVTIAIALATAPIAVAASAQNPMAEAVELTIRTHLERRNGLENWDLIAPRVRKRMHRIYAQGQDGWITTQSWFVTAGYMLRDAGLLPIKPFAGWPEQVADGECFGMTCRIDDPNDPNYVEELANSLLKGARVIQNCWQLEWKPTEAQNFIRVPSVVLPTGNPIKRDTVPAPSYFSGGRNLEGHRLDHADTEAAAILWGIHLRNIGLPKERWGGCSHVFRRDSTSIGCSYRDPPYRDLAGNLVIPNVDNVRGNQNGNFWLGSNIGNGPGTSVDCPQAEGGADFDFYSFSSTGESSPFNTQDSCTWYAKNFALGPMGYGYPETVVVQISTDVMERAHRHNGMGYQCPVSKEFIRALAGEIYKSSNFGATFDYPEFEPFLLSDVRIGSRHPLGRDLAVNPKTGVVTSSDQLPPDVIPQDNPGQEPPEYEPLPAGQPGNNTGGQTNGDTTGNVNPGNIDFSSPTVDDPEFTVPEVGLIDWLPGFSNLNLDNSGAQCPLFGFEAFGESFQMDSFCPTLEEWREAIAAIMLVTFTMLSYSVVLRA